LHDKFLFAREISEAPRPKGRGLREHAGHPYTYQIIAKNALFKTF